MQRAFIAFFITMTLIAGLLGLIFDWWSGTEAFREFATSTIQSAANESGASLDLEKGRSDLRTAGLLIFFTIATMAWMPILGLAIRAKILDEDLIENPASRRKFRVFAATSLGLWITNLIVILRA